MKKEYIINRQGKDMVLYAGLLDAAHSDGLVGMRTTLLQAPSDTNGFIAICHASATTTKGTFEGIGDASAANVGKNIIPHIIRMAETRAKARALRDAINVGAVSVEEMGPDEDDDDHNYQSGGDTYRKTNPSNGVTATAAQVKAMYVIARNEMQMNDAKLERTCAAIYGHLPSELNKAQASEAIERLKAGTFDAPPVIHQQGTTGHQTPVQPGNADVRTIDTTTGEIQEYRPGNHKSAENIRAKFRASTLDGDTSTISEDDADTLEMILNDHTHNGAASRAIVAYLCGKTVTFKTVSRIEMTKLLDLVNADSAAKLLATLTPAALEWNTANPHSEPSLHEQLFTDDDEPIDPTAVDAGDRLPL